MGQIWEFKGESGGEYNSTCFVLGNDGSLVLSGLLLCIIDLAEKFPIRAIFHPERSHRFSWFEGRG